MNIDLKSIFISFSSGSMKGPTMHLSRITLLYILATLNPNDYIAGVWFNKNFASILDCSNTTFIPATTRNKKVSEISKLYNRMLSIIQL